MHGRGASAAKLHVYVQKRSSFLVNFRPMSSSSKNRFPSGRGGSADPRIPGRRHSFRSRAKLGHDASRGAVPPPLRRLPRPSLRRNKWNLIGVRQAGGGIVVSSPSRALGSTRGRAPYLLLSRSSSSSKRSSPSSRPTTVLSHYFFFCVGLQLWLIHASKSFTRQDLFRHELS